MKHVKRMLAAPLMIAVMALVVIAAVLPSGYVVLRPGGSYEVGPRLDIPPEYRKEMGYVAFTAVLVGPATWVDVVDAWVDPAAETIPVAELRPPDISPEQFEEINRRLIEESKQIAAAVALQAAGYETRVTGQGVRVVDVLAGMPAEGVLRPGDLIIAVDGQPTDTAAAVLEATRRHAVGDQVTLTIIRDGQRQDVSVGTTSSVDEPGRPVVGTLIATEGFNVELPFPVDVRTDGVVGASAGLMFSVGILDGVTDGVLTRGHRVAGTGTISVDWSIGPIAGAAEKVVAAERDGADVFLVPRQNYDEARAGARSARVVPVDRFEDAVRAVCSLEPTAGLVDAAPPPPCSGPVSSAAGR